MSQGDETDHLGSPQAGSQPQQSPFGEKQPSQKKVRQPAWSTELENRRRLVEPALRTSSVVLGGLRKSTGTLMFLLDAASADSRFVALQPCRMPIDESGNPNGQPKAHHHWASINFFQDILMPMKGEFWRISLAQRLARHTMGARLLRSGP